MKRDGVILEKNGKVATITLDMPETRNALSLSIIEYIDKQVDEVIKDKDIQCLIITGGTGKFFVSGANIENLEVMTPSNAKDFIEAGHKLFTKIETLDIPTIAAINGYCLGGGLELSMCCDIRICTRRAWLGLPEIKIGMIPGWGGALRLQKLIGQSRAKYMILRGHMISSQKALDFGLVSEVYGDIKTMREKANELADELAGYAPITMKMIKRQFYDAANKQTSDIAETDALALAFLQTTEDAKEGLRAYLQKRQPTYKGR
ncbi:crotonase [Pullulanibacillus camelliae]|uniref:Crotonase n=1 Tax=Pullulanibacillus camelliae TaxID=1707096 RepID=A0A8J2VP78_9BACL|nr:enoyl-CoA hydratase/isomerase family protein [Pullulanibacillus camelliae]GGE35276.1 crotonase [Pullulanibacillus camelliae]